jgi:hypothetical protein
MFLGMESSSEAVPDFWAVFGDTGSLTIGSYRIVQFISGMKHQTQVVPGGAVFRPSLYCFRIDLYGLS